MQRETLQEDVGCDGLVDSRHTSQKFKLRVREFDVIKMHNQTLLEARP